MRTTITTGAGGVHVTSAGLATDPVVVLSSGLGGAWFDWSATVDLLARHARVVVFDRPGTGDSGPASADPTLAREVAVLEAVLGDAPTAVFVGHSMATMHVEAFARLHPDRVRAVVLLDPDPESPGAGRPFDLSSVVARWLPLLIPREVGAALVRRHGHLLRRWVIEGSTLARFDPAPEALVKDVYRRPHVAKSVLAELAAYPDQVADLDELRAAHPLPDVPFDVLTAGRRLWPEHAALARLAPWGRNVLVPGSRHMIPVDRPDAVVMAVRDALRASRAA
ncbi:alpha/beta fold hydrolase [Umezawaea sp. Da 62-37]|uniref:alpha/beta fold hydrolase n=1 Tax=Umezawaea sp. Da 62-37 TaxID=3075927 RepID=UPI0028F717F7|nr:alpha/beta fold hydrolase [Umezawaea sp. Da 62-37]WNV82546.1 alpha/beta fold hydrolase [Umezawaea sp. Da 62-37]